MLPRCAFSVCHVLVLVLCLSAAEDFDWTKNDHGSFYYGTFPAEVVAATHRPVTWLELVDPPMAWILGSSGSTLCHGVLGRFLTLLADSGTQHGKPSDLCDGGNGAPEKMLAAQSCVITEDAGNTKDPSTGDAKSAIFPNKVPKAEEELESARYNDINGINTQTLIGLCLTPDLGVFWRKENPCTKMRLMFAVFKGSTRPDVDPGHQTSESWGRKKCVRIPVWRGYFTAWARFPALVVTPGRFCIWTESACKLDELYGTRRNPPP
ncbi:lactase-like protein isoform X1 [Lates japonicus]|uniref:Lactase-like protein isoform X1 n=1 Tax=Lates japonicus TaxID=270547 RepID=A0AAD3MP82_LATJO|nr:lactase-like protein isoform X1 [Lates japonicus]